MNERRSKSCRSVVATAEDRLADVVAGGTPALTEDEIGLLIEFFTILDRWDREEKRHEKTM